MYIWICMEGFSTELLPQYRAIRCSSNFFFLPYCSRRRLSDYSRVDNCAKIFSSSAKILLHLISSSSTGRYVIE